jgi:hypothetical protein
MWKYVSSDFYTHLFTSVFSGDFNGLFFFLFCFVYLTDRLFFRTQFVPGNAIVSRIVFSHRRIFIRSRLRAVRRLWELLIMGEV